MAQGALVVEFGADGRLNGDLVPAGAVELAESFDRLGFGDVDLCLRNSPNSGGQSTLVAHQEPQMRQASFRFLPTGGRLSLVFEPGPGAVEVELSELRSRLVAALLTPPRPYEAGEEIPDEVLIRSIWPRSHGRDRTDLNTLIYRTRKDLLRAGLNPGLVFERTRHGGSVRMRLAKGARVEVA
jgi:hypothetical protein